MPETFNRTSHVIQRIRDDWKHLGKKFVGPQVAAFLPLVQVWPMLVRPIGR